jgi:hypothetical protein
MSMPKLKFSEIKPLLGKGIPYREIGVILARAHGRKMPYQGPCIGRLVCAHRKLEKERNRG